ncbi:hypothetical protein K458DRAFT_407296 [Lentithecium fluviatile CBS 122367]|uniref:Uncharacterized protein n=1 Tax=Lentithecium fluviatile CBS 122367 TaxID=1168545 RepID=A0A6G1IRF8_9PLEO|nr:hypothetical protein K458DRAFT_407296 [Lentithecium fluviatile CBS 122367]
MRFRVMGATLSALLRRAARLPPRRRRNIQMQEKPNIVRAGRIRGRGFGYLPPMKTAPLPSDFGRPPLGGVNDGRLQSLTFGNSGYLVISVRLCIYLHREGAPGLGMGMLRFHIVRPPEVLITPLGEMPWMSSGLIS